MIKIQRRILLSLFILFAPLFAQLMPAQRDSIKGLDSSIKQFMEDAQEPAYAPGTGPTILIDAAHHNGPIRLSSKKDGDTPIAHLLFEIHAKRLEEDGYLVRELKKSFDRESLNDVQIAIIYCPFAAQNAPRFWTLEELGKVWKPPFPSAFSREEIEILHDWVTMGGSLLLVFDHSPTPAAVQDLATVFGIEIRNGFAFDERLLRWEGDKLIRKGAGKIVFQRTDQSLADDPVTNGRSPSERIDLVTFYTGSAFRLPPQGLSLLTFGQSFVSLEPEIPFRFKEDTLRKRIGGWSQGGVLRVGKGRLAVFGEASILVDPDILANPTEDWQKLKAQNPQLFLNVLHWLSSLLDESH